MGKIDLKYVKPYTAKYNAGVYTCPECGEELLHNLYDNIYGFADTNIGNLAMVECPKCFYKWSFHSRINSPNNTYDYFLLSIEENENVHFKQ
jgi:DNA-directed RNA polymerase subunit RPC12/RpoP